MPGAITMPLIGFLIGTMVIPAGTTFMWATFGAILGDFLSYLLGVYFKDRIHRIWPFTKWPMLLQRSEIFFSEHGGKSVFICRFIGPMRAMVPMVAGACKMPMAKFLLASMPAATIWSIIYMLPGILLGAISLELPPKVATQFMVGMLGVFVILWLCSWFIQYSSKKIFRAIDHHIKSLWQYLQRQPALAKITNFISDPREPDNHRQLTLIIATILLTLVLILVANQAITMGFLFELGRKIYHFLSSIRVKWLDHIFVVITFLGDLPFLLLLSGLIFILLRWKKNWYTAIHWFLLIMATGFATKIMKMSIYVPRPGEVLYDLHSSSFPSAHVALSTAIYGFLAVILTHDTKEETKQLIYHWTIILIGFIALSRIYLGAHWLCDILGGFLTGTIMVSIVTIFYRRKQIFHFNVQEFAKITLIIFIISWLGYGTVNFNKQIKYYNLAWPRYIVKFDSLLKNGIKSMPLYRINRFGKPIEAFNLIYAGNLTALEQVLQKNGWELQKSKMDFNNVIKSISPSYSHLPLFTQLYHNKKMIRLFTKTNSKNDKAYILRLWPSEIDLIDSDVQVWIGDVENHRFNSTLFSWEHFKSKPIFIGATEILAKDLQRNFNLWHRTHSSEKDQKQLSELKWDKKLLIIREK